MGSDGGVFWGSNFFLEKGVWKIIWKKGSEYFCRKYRLFRWNSFEKWSKKWGGRKKLKWGGSEFFFSRKRGRGNFKFLFKWWSWFSLGHAGAKVLNCMELFFSSIFEPASFLQNGKKNGGGFPKLDQLHAMAFYICISMAQSIYKCNKKPNHRADRAWAFPEEKSKIPFLKSPAPKLVWELRRLFRAIFDVLSWR